MSDESTQNSEGGLKPRRIEGSDCLKSWRHSRDSGAAGEVGQWRNDEAQRGRTWGVKAGTAKLASRTRRRRALNDDKTEQLLRSALLKARGRIDYSRALAVTATFSVGTRRRALKKSSTTAGAERYWTGVRGVWAAEIEETSKARSATRDKPLKTPGWAWMLFLPSLP